MKHASTRDLFAYWDRTRGERPAPERSEIEPGAIRQVLPDTFILTFDNAAGHPFRIAGTRVCALVGRELKAEGFLDFWHGSDRTAVTNLLAVLAHESTGIVASVTGETAKEQTAPLELLLLPLDHHGRKTSRLIGSLAAIDPPYWLGVDPFVRLTLGSFRHIGTPSEIPLAPAFGAPLPAFRQKHGLTVYDGGKNPD